jgi:hypothetical protein
MAVNCATAGVAIIAAVLLRMNLAHLNKKLDRGEHVEGAINNVPRDAADKGFRFLL